MKKRKGIFINFDKNSLPKINVKIEWLLIEIRKKRGSLLVKNVKSSVSPRGYMENASH